MSYAKKKGYLLDHQLNYEVFECCCDKADRVKEMQQNSPTKTMKKTNDKKTNNKNKRSK